MIIVDRTKQNRTVTLKDFYETKGLINTKSSVLSFDWKNGHGIVNGYCGSCVYQITKINDIFNKTENFGNFTILRKWDIDYEKCNTLFVNPCPYYRAALSSLMMPTALALISFLVMTCCTCCSMQGM